MGCRTAALFAETAVSDPGYTAARSSMRLLLGLVCAVFVGCSSSPPAAALAPSATLRCEPEVDPQCVCVGPTSCPATLGDALRQVAGECPRLYRGFREQGDGITAVTSSSGLAATTFYYDARGALIGSWHLNDDASPGREAGRVVHELGATCSLCPGSSGGFPPCEG